MDFGNFDVDAYLQLSLNTPNMPTAPVTPMVPTSPTSNVLHPTSTSVDILYNDLDDDDLNQDNGLYQGNRHSVNVVIYILVAVYYKWVNKRRDEIRN